MLSKEGTTVRGNFPGHVELAVGFPQIEGVADVTIEGDRSHQIRNK